MPRLSLPSCCRLYDNILFAERTDTGVALTYMKGPRSDDDARRIQELMATELATAKRPTCYAFVNFRRMAIDGKETDVTDKTMLPVVDGTVTFYGAPEDWGNRPITGHDSKHVEYSADEFHEKVKSYIAALPTRSSCGLMSGE